MTACTCTPTRRAVIIWIFGFLISPEEHPQDVFSSLVMQAYATATLLAWIFSVKSVYGSYSHSPVALSPFLAASLCLSFFFQASQHTPSAFVLPTLLLRTSAAIFKSPHRHVILYTSISPTLSFHDPRLPLCRSGRYPRQYADPARYTDDVRLRRNRRAIA